MYVSTAVDYILFVKTPVDVTLNENEVQAVKYVTPEELRKMFENPGECWCILSGASRRIGVERDRTNRNKRRDAKGPESSDMSMSHASSLQCINRHTYDSLV